MDADAKSRMLDSETLRLRSSRERDLRWNGQCMCVCVCVCASGAIRTSTNVHDPSVDGGLGKDTVTPGGRNKQYRPLLWRVATLTRTLLHPSTLCDAEWCRTADSVLGCNKVRIRGYVRRVA